MLSLVVLGGSLLLGSGWWLSRQPVPAATVAVGTLVRPSTPLPAAARSRGVSRERHALPTRQTPAVVISLAASPTPSPTATQAAQARPATLYLGEQALAIQTTHRALLTEEGQTVWRWEVPLTEVGHHEDSPSFGEGLTVLVGHSIWYGTPGVFDHLAEVAVGDRLTGVDSLGQPWQYQVTTIGERAYGDGSWFSPAATQADLILYTCDQSLTHLVVVEATLIAGDDSKGAVQ